jgi:hypothetical protein
LARLRTPLADKGPVRMELIEQGPDLPWVMAIVNHGDRPVRVLGDPRLMKLKVQAPGKKKPVTCELPQSVRPWRADTEMEQTLSPGQGLYDTLDPRLYCFASKGQSSLVPGAQVTPEYGWPTKKRMKWQHGKAVEQPPDPPFIAMIAVDTPDSRPASLNDPTPNTKGAAPVDAFKQLAGSMFALGSEYSRWSRHGIPSESEEAGPLHFQLNSGSDVQEELGTMVSVTLKNRSKHKEIVYFRRELISFEVMGPDGLSQCDAKPDDRAPEPQSFARLGPGGSVSATSRLVELCPRGTFAHPGLYLVHARFDANQKGAMYGLDAYVGEVVSDNPVAIRIRRGDFPYTSKHKMRSLELAVGDGGVK